MLAPLFRRRAILSLLAGLVTILIHPSTFAQEAKVDSPAAKPAPKWAKDMAAFAAQDKAHPPKTGGILFVGSSSIRLWDLKKSFPDLPVTNRGFGGSQVSDSVEHFDELITPHKPRVIVFYAGDNDIAAKKSPAEVAGNFEKFMAKVHQIFPKTHIVYIPIKPSGSRWGMIEPQREQNKLVREKFAEDKLFTYLEVEPLMLKADGTPDDELFVKDHLHMNEAGYAKWVSLLRPLLDKLLAEKE